MKSSPFHTFKNIMDRRDFLRKIGVSLGGLAFHSFLGRRVRAQEDDTQLREKEPAERGGIYKLLAKLEPSKITRSDNGSSLLGDEIRLNLATAIEEGTLDIQSLGSLGNYFRDAGEESYLKVSGRDPTARDEQSRVRISGKRMYEVEIKYVHPKQPDKSFLIKYVESVLYQLDQKGTTYIPTEIKRGFYVQNNLGVAENVPIGVGMSMERDHGDENIWWLMTQGHDLPSTMELSQTDEARKNFETVSTSLNLLMPNGAFDYDVQIVESQVSNQALAKQKRM